MKKKKTKKGLQKGDRMMSFGIPFTWTGNCWVNDYINKKDGLFKENN